MEYINIKTFKEKYIEIELRIKKEILYPFVNELEIDLECAKEIRENAIRYVDRCIEMFNELNYKLLPMFPIFEDVKKIIISNENMVEILDTLNFLYQKNQTDEIYTKKIIINIDWEYNLLGLKNRKVKNICCIQN